MRGISQLDKPFRFRPEPRSISRIQRSWWNESRGWKTASFAEPIRTVVTAAQGIGRRGGEQSGQRSLRRGLEQEPQIAAEHPRYAAGPHAVDYQFGTCDARVGGDALDAPTPALLRRCSSSANMRQASLDWL